MFSLGAKVRVNSYPHPKDTDTRGIVAGHASVYRSIMAIEGKATIIHMEPRVVIALYKGFYDPHGGFITEIVAHPDNVSLDNE